ncbi:efflux transporter outer membrane subunit [Persicobacter diffluens]|uniref:Membrane protein n=1 Tax=Persicobacter diffluens TaxID=981 RepID=A0AAN4W286_9BACT|nr:membrane protein [Persicobacter diffluens]
MNSKQHFWWMPFLVVLLVQSCKMGPNYSRPEVDVQVDWDSLAVEEDLLSDLKWWDLYQDTILGNYIKQALTDNFDVRKSVARLKEVKAFRRIESSNLYPTINGNAYAEGEASGASPNKLDEEYQVSAQLAWEVDLWGKLRRGVEAANADYIASYEAYRALMLSTVAEVATVYFNLQDVQNRLRITRRTLVARQEALRIAELRFKGGLVSEIEFQQASVELAQTKALLPGLERRVRLSMNELSVLLGRPPAELEMGIALENQPVIPSIPLGLSSLLLERRPDIRLVEQNLVAANAEIGIAKANFYPSFVITGELGYQSSSLSNFVGNGFNYWDYLGDLITPIFTAGRNKANLEATRARYEQRLYDYQSVVLTGLQEVSDGLISFQKAREQRQAQAELVKASEEYFRLAQLQYLNGIVNYLDVLDAQRRLFDAEISESAAIRDQLVSMVFLYKALGGGWDPESMQPEIVPKEMQEQ